MPTDEATRWVGSLPAAALVLNHASEVLAANDRARDLLGSRLFDALWPGDDELLRAAVAAVVDGADDHLVVDLRLGTEPPADFVRLELGPGPVTGSVAAIATDITDESRLEATASALGSGVYVADADLNILWVSPGTARALGVDPGAQEGNSLVRQVHPDDYESLGPVFASLLEQPGSEATRIARVRHPDVPDVWWKLRITMAWLPDDPAVGGMMISWQIADDLVDLDGSEPAGRDTPGHLTLAETSPAGIIAATSAGRIYYRNAMALALVGDGLDDGDAYSWIAAADAEFRAQIEAILRAAGRDQGRGMVTAPFPSPSGTRWLRIEAIPQVGADGQPIGWVASLLDVTEETETRVALEEAQARLWHLANHDALTGLPNRSLFVDRLATALERERRAHHGVAVLYCDLDRFKPVNDRLGHHYGDAVLVETGRRIAAAVRAADTVCRFGGDEFLVLCENVDDEDQIRAVAERVLDAVEAPITINGFDASVGVTIGLAFARPDDTPDDLLARADLAMYEGKDAGRSRVVVAA